MSILSASKPERFILNVLPSVPFKYFNVLNSEKMIASEEVDKEGEAVSKCVGEDLSHPFEVILKDFPEVVSYIKRLNEHVKKQQNMLLKLYEKLKEYKSRCATTLDCRVSFADVATQTENSDFQKTSQAAIPPHEHSEWGSGSFSGNNLAEEVKKVAENAMQQTGFVYEETSGMYYDYNTGYYYNAELGLYYDGHSGTYMYYNEATKCYEYHSQAPVPTSNHDINSQNFSMEAPEIVSDPVTLTSVDTGEKTAFKDENQVQRCQRICKDDRKSKRKSMDRSSFKSDGSAEEGECSDSSSNFDDTDNTVKRDSVEHSNNRVEKKPSSRRKHSEEWPRKESHVSDSDADNLVPDKKMKKEIQSRRLSDEAGAAWPPCMRIIVQTTDVKGLSIGTLFIVTCKGGTLGREKFHAVCIPDINISKHHGKFLFEERDGGKYFLIDYGSRNGTYVNKKRLSAAKQESEPCEITHGTIVTLGSTDLLCHIHPGRETCEECEPGVVAAKIDHDPVNSVSVPRENKSEMRKLELKRLRRRFGLESNESKGDLLGAGYEDRAEIRRITVGSQNEHAKTEAASVTESIKSSNKGFEMLAKMGWKQGDSLGKDGTGLTEPVLVSQRADKAGLGADNAFVTAEQPGQDPRAKRRADMWARAQQRYDQISNQDGDAEGQH